MSGLDSKIVWGKETDEVNGRLVVDRNLLVGNIQQDINSCVYIAALFMAHVCGDGTYDRVSAKVLTNNKMFNGAIEILKNGNFRNSRMSKFEAFDYLSVGIPEQFRPKKWYEVAYDGEKAGQTAKRVLSQGYITMLEQGGHAFVAVGESENGKLIVWDSLLGEKTHGLREIDANSENLSMFLCAKVNPKFKSSV